MNVVLSAIFQLYISVPTFGTQIKVTHRHRNWRRYLEQTSILTVFLLFQNHCVYFWREVVGLNGPFNSLPLNSPAFIIFYLLYIPVSGNFTGSFVLQVIWCCVLIVYVYSCSRAAFAFTSQQTVSQEDMCSNEVTALKLRSADQRYFTEYHILPKLQLSSKCQLLCISFWLLIV